jgi:hypothetical protein
VSRRPTGPRIFNSLAALPKTHQALAFDARLPNPTNPSEQKCEQCDRLATSVINGTPECDEHVGKRILDGENPEIIGKLVADYLSRK